MMELLPLDMAVCQRKVETWYKPRDISQSFFNWRVACHSRHLFPGGEVYGNHVRIYVGIPAEGMPALGFEWTYPTARFFEWKEWMHQAPYARMCRYIAGPPPASRQVFEACLHHDGTPYDIGQLCDIGLGTRFLDFGKNMMVCSVGAVHVAQQTTGDLQMFPGIAEREAPPCVFLNSDKWDVRRTECPGVA